MTLPSFISNPTFIHWCQGLLIIGFWIAFLGWAWKCARAVPDYLVRWAQSHGYEVLKFERRTFRTGPYNPLSTRATKTPKSSHLHSVAIYLVKIRDREGRKRSCWVLCSGGFKDPNYRDLMLTEVVEWTWI